MYIIYVINIYIIHNDLARGSVIVSSSIRAPIEFPVIAMLSGGKKIKKIGQIQGGGRRWCLPLHRM